MYDDPVYFSYAEFQACFPDFTGTQDEAENIIREAESILDVHVNCEKCRIDWGVYSCVCCAPCLWGNCCPVRYINCPPERTFPRCEDCCPGDDQGTYDPTAVGATLPQNTTKFQYWLVTADGTVGGVAMLEGQYLIALSTRSVTQERNFAVLDEEPVEFCFIPDDVRRAMKILVGDLIKINAGGGSSDCLEGKDITIGKLSIKNSSNSNNATDQPYSNQYYDLLDRYRCLGGQIP